MKNKKIANIQFVFAAILVLVATSACNQKKKPADMPQLFPCEITVVQDGKPLEGATVNLTADGTSLRFTVAAKTDKNGVAKIKTDIDWPGAPAGKYKVCISKVVAPEVDNTTPIPSDPVEYAAYQKKLAESSAQTKSLVDSKYLRPHTTPESIEVTASGYKATIDVGPAVDQLWNNVSGSSSSGSR